MLRLFTVRKWLADDLAFRWSPNAHLHTPHKMGHAETFQSSTRDRILIGILVQNRKLALVYSYLPKSKPEKKKKQKKKSVPTRKKERRNFHLELSEKEKKKNNQKKLLRWV